MVATRDQRRAKRCTVTGIPLRTVSMVVPVRSIDHVIGVFDYDVVISSGRVLANHRDHGAAQLVFDGPSGENAREVQTMAVRWLRRRGPRYAPSGTSVRVALAANSRGRVMERA